MNTIYLTPISKTLLSAVPDQYLFICLEYLQLRLQYNVILTEMTLTRTYL